MSWNDYVNYLRNENVVEYGHIISRENGQVFASSSGLTQVKQSPSKINK
jgi:hypothetical protein